MRLAAVHHLAVRAPDLPAAERFYVEVLGLVVRERFAHPDGSPRSVWVELGGGAFLAIEATPLEGPRRGDEHPGWHCVALAIDAGDREAWRQRLIDAGHPIERETEFTLYVRDPAGALLGLSHYPLRIA
jgi:catechol 2,3-dioxygenase-like lactoylglutathione lyase family enzyme